MRKSRFTEAQIIAVLREGAGARRRRFAAGMGSASKPSIVENPSMATWRHRTPIS
jgi:hypothetical protein